MLESHGGYIFLRGRREKSEVTLKRLNGVATQLKEKDAKAKCDPLDAYTTLGAQVAGSLQPPGPLDWFQPLPQMNTIDIEAFCEKNQMAYIIPGSWADVRYYVTVGVSLSPHCLSTRLLKALIDAATCVG